MLRRQFEKLMTQDKACYKMIASQMRALVDNETDIIANLANISALLFQSLDDINWAGFYILKKNELVLGPFQGKPACIRIPLGKGVCGTSALNKETIVVKDVHDFEGHISCDSASNSEIVIPIMRGGKVFGVLDIDSPMVGRFDNEDKEGLEVIVKIIQTIL